MDAAIAAFFWDMKDSLVYDIFKIISGKTYIILTCIPFVFAAFFSLRKKFIFFLLAVIVSVSVSDILCCRVLKPSIKRLRPAYELDLSREKPMAPVSAGAYSMPSNHASNITAFFIVYLLMAGRFRTILFINTLLIAFSRIVIVKHYPTDVLAGIVVGAVIGLAVSYAGLFIQDKFFLRDT